jgi:hypothetical protein
MNIIQFNYAQYTTDFLELKTSSSISSSAAAALAAAVKHPATHAHYLFFLGNI